MVQTSRQLNLPFTLPGPVLIITGPTASGKSACAFETARMNDGEIICADSMQIYKDMDIGTAKPSIQEREEIPHHLFDMTEPDKSFSVADYTELVKPVIADILSRDKLPILCGGTGQYISALINGISFPVIPFNADLRSDLEDEADIYGTDDLYMLLDGIDPEAAKIISPNDRKRIIRALEVNILSGKTKSELENASKAGGPQFEFLSFCISHERQTLYNRINDRVDRMIDEGLVDEVRYVRNKYSPLSKSASQAIGYKELPAYFSGAEDIITAIDTIKQATRNYAKRQLTWFRKIPSLIWLLDATPSDNAIAITEALKKYK